MDEQTPTPEQPAEDTPAQHAPLPFANPVSGSEPGGASGPGAPDGGEARLATFGRRLLGYLLDGLILAVPTLILGAVFHGSNGSRWIGNLLGLAITFLYAFWLIANKNGQTIGMTALKIRCVREVDGGQVDNAMSAQRAGYAAAFSFVSLFIIIPIIIDLLWPLWDKKNQTLHDELARTVVIDIRENPNPNTISF